jgi:anthranilate phosphoribosyltransferase
MQEQSLKTFGSYIQRLIRRQALSRQEAYEAFQSILTHAQPDLQQGALLAAMVAKGETIHEMAGAWEAIFRHDTVRVAVDEPATLMENSGTGMDALKTFNVSSAAGIVASACGVRMARHGARALTSSCGTVDMLESLGVDAECPAGLVAESIRREGIGLFNGMSAEIHPAALARILSQIRFGSTLNIAASLANPAAPQMGVRGVYAATMLEPVATLMQEIGYRRGIVVHGHDQSREGGMDECSITGKTVMRVFGMAGAGELTIQPEDAGLRTAPFEEIAALGDREQERTRFLRVLAGVDHAACMDFTCLNAGAVLWVAGKADSLSAGVDLSREALLKGAALRKLGAWVEAQNRQPAAGRERLQQAVRTAGVTQA